MGSAASVRIHGRKEFGAWGWPGVCAAEERRFILRACKISRYSPPVGAKLGGAGAIRLRLPFSFLLEEAEVLSTQKAITTREENARNLSSRKARARKEALSLPLQTGAPLHDSPHARAHPSRFLPLLWASLLVDGAQRKSSCSFRRRVLLCFFCLPGAASLRHHHLTSQQS